MLFGIRQLYSLFRTLQYPQCYIPYRYSPAHRATARVTNVKHAVRRRSCTSAGTIVESFLYPSIVSFPPLAVSRYGWFTSIRSQAVACIILLTFWDPDPERSVLRKQVVTVRALTFPLSLVSRGCHPESRIDMWSSGSEFVAADRL